MVHKIFGILLLVGTAATTRLAAAAVTFTDTTFNDLANYSVESYQSGGGTINIFQTLTAGNPAQALEIDRTVPPGSFLAVEYFLNRSFIYDPGTQGAVTSIGFSGDVFFQAPVSISGEFDVALISQAGNLYATVITLPASTGVWETGSASNVQASDFGLITNKSLFAIDSTRHPNFSSGSLEFGFLAAWGIPGGTSGYTGVERIDNVSLTINSATSTPEPATCRVMILGLAVIGLVIPVRLQHRAADRYSLARSFSSRPFTISKQSTSHTSSP